MKSVVNVCNVILVMMALHAEMYFEGKWLFGKCNYLFSCQELHEKTDTCLMCTNKATASSELSLAQTLETASMWQRKLNSPNL